MTIADLRIKYAAQLRAFYGRPVYALTDEEVRLFVALREQYL